MQSGQSVHELRQWMLESEFSAHHAKRLLTPGGEVKTAHVLQFIAPAVLTIANVMGAKFRVTADQLDPWEAERKKRKPREGADDRIRAFMETQRLLSGA